MSRTQYWQYNITAETGSSAEFRYAWVNAMVGDVCHLFDALQLSSSHFSITIELSNLSLLAGFCESFERRHPMGASIFLLLSVPSFSEWYTVVSYVTLRFFAWCISLIELSEGSIHERLWR